MSVLSQFFSGGGTAPAEGGIPAEILIVNGGSGAWCTCSCSSYPFSPGYYISFNQGMGGYTADIHKCVLSGATCPITVGAGGASQCRDTVNSISPYCCVRCCIGGSGCASKFGCIGGTDRAQGTTPADARINVPYGIDKLSLFGCPWNTQIGPTEIVCNPCLDGATTTVVYFPRYGAAPTTSICSSFTNSPFYAGLCLTFGAFNQCPLACLEVPGADSTGNRGQVSKITGTVQEYGASKTLNGFQNGLGPLGCCVPVCKTRPHPTSLGEGSGHGAWRCEGVIMDACPGTVIIQYPTDYDASSVSSPNVCDCSPQTPGYRTYRFLCPGSITFP